MPALAQTIEGTILNRVETGESHLRISLFSGKNGLKLVLLRIYKRNRSVPPPDLFDDVEFNVNIPRNGSGLPFVKDFQIIKKRAKVAHHHLRFQIASLYCHGLVLRWWRYMRFVEASTNPDW